MRPFTKFAANNHCQCALSNLCRLMVSQSNSLIFIRLWFYSCPGNKWDRQKMVPSSVLLDRISIAHPGVYRVSDETNDTARSYRVSGYLGSFGFISSMSDHFCGSCNRLRLTADGQIKVSSCNSFQGDTRYRSYEGLSV